ncbi:hypothetical protein [Desulfurococcus mucosus]|uniref:hypothetical protein n=1 Tax=Desulfurococcus mucosus TaxID=2275 RepID=UPI003CCA71BE
MVALKTPILATRILLLVLIAGSLIQLTPVNPQTGDWNLEGYSYRSRSGGDIYPGSQATQLTVDLRYMGSTSATSPYACLVLPDGFTARGSGCSSAMYPNGTYIHVISPGDIARYSFTVDVASNVNPGGYPFTLNVSYYVGGVVEYYVTQVWVNVSPYPPLAIEVEEAYFTPYGYAGSNPVSLYVKLVNKGNSSVTSMDLTLELPGDYFTPREVNSSYTGNIDYGDTASIVFSNIQIKPYTPPGVYTAVLKVSAGLSTSDGVTYRESAELSFQIGVDAPPQVDLRVLDYSLTAQYPLPGLNNTGIRLMLQSLEPGAVRILYLRTELVNAAAGNGTSTIVQGVEGTVSYMDVVELRVTGLNIASNADTVEARVEIACMVNRDQSWYPATYVARLAIPLQDLSRARIAVSNVSWTSIEAYPGSTGLGLTVTLLNSEGFTIRDADAVLELPAVFRPREVFSRNIVVNQYSLTEVVFNNIDVAPDAAPGVYAATMTLKGFLSNSDGSVRYIELSFTIALRVSSTGSVEEWKPRLVLVNYYWGEGTPIYVYPGNPRAGLTVEVANTGVYQASNVILELNAPGDLIPLTGNATCTAALAPGATCTAVFYLNLSRAQPGLKTFNVTARFIVNAFNTRLQLNESMSFTLILPSYGAGGGVTVASSGWSAGNPVYPGEKGAVYTVTLANLEPYPVYSMWVSVETPSCIVLHEGSSRTVYVSGPLNSLQTTTVSYVVDALCGVPGSYTGYLYVDYYVQYAGGGYRRSFREPVAFVVSEPGNTVEVVKTGWVGSAPMEEGRGLSYMVVVRNNGFPSLSNPVLTLYLPPGFLDASSNTGIAVATPTATIPSQQLSLPIQGIDVSTLLQVAQGQRSTGAQRGDLMVFIVRLHVLNASAGVYSVPFTLSFTDHWGYVYSVNSTLQLQLDYQPPLLTVRPVSPLIYFTNGSSMLEVEVVNEYNASVYNVYVALIPASNNVIPQGAVKYIESLPGNSAARLRYEVVYNPVSLSIGGGVSASPSSAVFTVSLFYRDAYGYTRSLNTTLSAIVKPFISLELTPDTTAKYVGGRLSINGIVLNKGLAQARSLLVKAYYGGSSGYSFIGDVDPSSQTPFRIDLYPARYLENCTVVLEFRDEYNTLYTLSYTIPVQYIEQTVTVTQPQAGGLSEYYIVIVVAVVVFLAAVFYMLHKYVSRHRAVAG